MQAIHDGQSLKSTRCKKKFVNRFLVLLIFRFLRSNKFVIKGLMPLTMLYFCIFVAEIIK